MTMPHSEQTPSFLSRRRFLGTSLAGSAALLGGLTAATPARAETPMPACCAASGPSRYQIAVCDWMILQRQRLRAFSRAVEIGADGIQLDMGGLGNRPTFANKLLDPVERRQFLDTSGETGIGFSSIAMSGFYGQDFATREIGPMVKDTVNTMNLMGVKTAFLPLGVPGDLLRFPEKRPVIIERLKWAGEVAAAGGVVIGVETAYPAEEEAAFLDEIGLPSIRSSFNFANALQNGRDLHAELRTLGTERICQIHASDTDGVWLEHNELIDMPAVKRTLDGMGWSGWLIVERSRDATRVRDVVANYGANVRYLKSVFQG